MVKDRILQDLKKTVEDLGYPTTDTLLSISKNPAFGDYSTNIALQLAKLDTPKDKQSPEEIAKKILEAFGKPDYLEKTEVAGGGFINFFIKDQALMENVTKVCSFGDSPVVVDKNKDKKVMVEFAHPNTHKAFHIGHLRNISIGESIVRLLEAVGTQVVRSNYEGDVGMHIAKAIYALFKISNFKSQIPDIEKQYVKAKVEFLGKAYAAGSKAFEEDEQAKKVIKDINFLIYASAQRFQEEKGIPASSTDYLKFVEGRTEEIDKVFELWKKTREWSLDYFETIYKRVYTHFDRYYFESECLSGVDVAREAVKKGILEENDGAVIFNGEKYGLDTRVFINSLGLPTYEAKELALAPKEFSEFGELDKIIHVVGPEQASFFKVTFKVEELLDSRFKNKQHHLVYGWVKLKSGKMSSRLGEVVSGESLLDEAKTQIKKEFPEMDAETAERVAVGAVKYSMLKFGTSSEISFSFEDSISLEGDSGPYLQYSYARAKSVLRSAKYEYKAGLALGKLEKEEREILRKIEYFEEIVEEAASNYTPNLLAGYLIDLAKSFNLFYQKHRILKGEEKMEFRLALTCGVATILKKGLYLLGIEAPERM